MQSVGFYTQSVRCQNKQTMWRWRRRPLLLRTEAASSPTTQRGCKSVRILLLHNNDGHRRTNAPDQTQPLRRSGVHLTVIGEGGVAVMFTSGASFLLCGGLKFQPYQRRAVAPVQAWTFHTTWLRAQRVCSHPISQCSQW